MRCTGNRRWNRWLILFFKPDLVVEWLCMQTFRLAFEIKWSLNNIYFAIMLMTLIVRQEFRLGHNGESHSSTGPTNSSTGPISIWVKREMWKTEFCCEKCRNLNVAVRRGEGVNQGVLLCRFHSIALVCTVYLVRRIDSIWHAIWINRYSYDVMMCRGRRAWVEGITVEEEQKGWGKEKW